MNQNEPLTATIAAPPTQKGQRLTSGNLQELLDSATNADQLGQQQFYTPLEYARLFALALPRYHGACLDFEMGAGHLLLALNGPLKCGVDLDERTRKPAGADGIWQTQKADVTKLYELWREVQFAADTIAINPPFSLRWHSERLLGLIESPVEAVAETAKALLRKPTIDSTLASLMIALDRNTARGEGFMVCNESTAIRALGDPDADFEGSDEARALRLSLPAGRLREHVWLWLTIPGGFFENVAHNFPVAVLYFAPSHRSDKPTHLIAPDNLPANIGNVLQIAASSRYSLRHGRSLACAGDGCEREAAGQFDAAKQEYATVHGQKDRPYNIWLNTEGVIERHLTPFQKASRRVDRTQVNQLNALAGQRPMALVVQKATRTALLSVIQSDLWKVEPSLLDKVHEAMGNYHAIRAPFYPLNDVQRLGYLDEEDRIVCRSDLNGDFLAGETYPIFTATRKVTRKGTKLSFSGEPQVVELTGVELFIHISDRHGNSHEFTHQPVETNAFSHNLEAIVRHFTIPDVADVARIRPEEYERNLVRLEELEELINLNRGTHPAQIGAATPPGVAAPSQSASRGKSYPLSAPIASTFPSQIPRSLQRFAFRQYQRDDLARSVMHDGCVFAWDTGLGKTAAIFGWSHLLHPRGCRAVLIVAPGGLHEQIIKDARELFGVTVKRLYSQDDFQRDHLLRSIALARANGQPHPLEKADRPVYWITSYIDLGFSGADEWTPREDDETGEKIVGHRLERERHQLPGWLPEHDEGIGEEPRGIRCLHRPSLATLTRHLFDAVACDEAVAIKSTESYRSLGVRRMEPAFRLVLTATPVKNHLDDLFWLVQWATGGHSEPTARWPYENTAAARERFANEHMVMERNVTAEQEALRKSGRFRSVKKRIPTICNVHHLWKLLGPCILRRRKADTGEDLVAKKIVPIKVRPGTTQQQVYAYHLTNPPQVNRKGDPMSVMSQVCTQLQILRQAALCPDTPNLTGATGRPHRNARSWSDFNPKVAAILKLVVDLISQGEQVVIMSPFQHFSETLFNRLRSAGVSACLLDGRMPPLKRGKVAEEFKARRYAVLIGGIDSMGAGYSFENAAHLILPSLSWAFDSNEQAINRVHRLNSPREVTIYTMVVENTIDEKLADVFREKGDCSSLALDGRLFADETREINLFELLQEAVRNFDPTATTISEVAVEQEWSALRSRLAIAEQAFRQWHPPITQRNPAGQSITVSPRKLEAEHQRMLEAAAEVEAREEAATPRPRASDARNRLADL